jgi:CRP-like cAMP-binding protein
MSPADRGRKLLEKCALFSSLDETARRDIAAYAKPRSFGTGEPICRLGDRGDSMMAVVVGTVRISLPTTRGKEVILADLRVGELFGEIAVLDGKPRSANVTAHTNCELMVLERRDLLPFLEEMAGGTREKVNRCLREWQRQGIIELKNRWTIIRKPDALRGLIDSI